MEEGHVEGDDGYSITQLSGKHADQSMHVVFQQHGIAL